MIGFGTFYMEKGFLVVFKSGKDRLIYTIEELNGDTVRLKSDVSTSKTADISQIREVTDIEILLGRRN